MMSGSTPRYVTGEEVRVADRIVYAGKPGRVVFVVDTGSFSSEYPEEEWSYLGHGFMIDAEGFGLVHVEAVDEDVDLVGRA